MKIQGELFETIKSALMEVLKANGLHPFMVQNNRHAWEVFHRACAEDRIDLNEIYRNHTDTHIETALKKMFKS